MFEQMFQSQAPHGTGAHCAPARGKARSACTRTGGTGRRPVPWCTVHRRYRRCSGPAPLVIPQAITYKTPRTLEIARARLQRRVQPYTSRVVLVLSKGGKRDRGLAPCSRPLSPACESCAAAPRHVAIMAPAHSTPQVETIKQYSGMVTVQRRVKDFPAAAGGGAAGGLSGRGDRVRSTPQVLCPPQGLAAVAEMSFSCHFP
jgi:hypothetical protein